MNPPPDEMLVSFLKALTDVVALCNGRVHHLEVYQRDDSLAQYPCLVYEQSDDIPERELGGNVGYWTTIYSVYIIAQNSSALRTLTDAVYTLGTETFNQSVWQQQPASYAMFEGLDVDSSSEDNEFAIEQQERGLKISTVSVSFQNSRC